MAVAAKIVVPGKSNGNGNKASSKPVAPKPVATETVYEISDWKEAFLTEEDFHTYSLDVLSILCRGRGLNASDDGLMVAMPNGSFEPLHTPLGRSFWVEAKLPDEAMVHHMLEVAYEAAFGKKHHGKGFQKDTLVSIWKTLSSELLGEYRKWMSLEGNPEAQEARAQKTVPNMKMTRFRVASVKLFDGVGEFTIHYKTRTVKRAPKPVVTKPVVKNADVKNTASKPAVVKPRIVAKVTAPVVQNQPKTGKVVARAVIRPRLAVK